MQDMFLAGLCWLIISVGILVFIFGGKNQSKKTEEAVGLANVDNMVSHPKCTAFIGGYTRRRHNPSKATTSRRVSNRSSITTTSWGDD